MKTISAILEQYVSAAMAAATSRPADKLAAIVKPSQNAKFGDYQANGVMALAKQLKTNPRELAQQVVERLDVSEMCETPEIAGPGFINFRLKPDWLAVQLKKVLADPQRLGVEPQTDAPVTVVDFSSPNIAKQMHVGHLRSTIIGDVIARVLEFLYDDENRWDFRFDQTGEHCTANPEKKVLRQNHVGDWGTQFGMLLRYAFHKSTEVRGAVALGYRHLGLEDWEDFYREAKKEFDSDPEAANQSRDWVVRLQQSDPYAIVLWTLIRNKSMEQCQEVYDQLAVNLKEEHVKSESSYNDEKLPSVIRELSAANLLKESDGAQCVFLEGFKSKDGEPLPLIVQKSDGAYLYATTDLAAIRYRVGDLKARRMIYVTDARQKLHFEMVFACARQAGWADENVELEHVPFGSVLGPDGSPFKTRSGENVKLKDLLDEATIRASNVVDKKAEERGVALSEDEKRDIARKVGIGAVKYADLSNNLVSDYVFHWDRMLALEGNTAPYLQYVYARIRSIFRTGNEAFDSFTADTDLPLDAPEEQALAKLILRYGEAIESVAQQLRPHLLTLYLFDLAQSFSSFYSQCPVLKADKPRQRSTRLTLCKLTADTMAHGLGLLGIEVPERM